MESFIVTVTNINGAINGWVWGPPMLALIICTGIYMTLRTRFFQITHSNEVNDKTWLAIFKKPSVTKTKEKKAITQFQALSTALAATIGTGNIAGVATAISLGGPGAV
ncbi:MAG: alanine:cation symporter family protein, partial [Treponema sp.]|nr:alanine:cation symporter family protein [Treponema sp.]